MNWVIDFILSIILDKGNKNTIIVITRRHYANFGNSVAYVTMVISVDGLTGKQNYAYQFVYFRIKCQPEK